MKDAYFTFYQEKKMSKVVEKSREEAVRMMLDAFQYNGLEVSRILHSASKGTVNQLLYVLGQLGLLVDSDGKVLYLSADQPTYPFVHHLNWDGTIKV